MECITSSDRARRLARVLVSDVAVYAGPDLRIGLEKDDLFDRLAPELDRAHAYYSYWVDASVVEREKIFAHAVVDVLVFAQRRVQTHIW